MPPFSGESSTSGSFPDPSPARRINSTALPHRPDGWFLTGGDAQRPPERSAWCPRSLNSARRHVADLLLSAHRDYLKSFGPISAATRAQLHLGVLADAGLKPGEVARITGLRDSVVALVARGSGDVNDDVLRTVLSVALAPLDSRGRTPALGASRRLRALMALGWTLGEIAARAGVDEDSLAVVANAQPKLLISRSMWWSVVTAYETLSGTPGPSQVVRAKAIQRSWVPPLGWDDEDLDHPAGRPQMPTSEVGVIDEILIERVMSNDAPGRPLTVAEEHAVIASAVRAGTSLGELAEKLGKSHYAAEKQMYRWKKHHAGRVRQDDQSCPIAS